MVVTWNKLWEGNWKGKQHSSLQVSKCLTGLLVKCFTFIKVETTNINMFEALEYLMSKLDWEKTFTYNMDMDGIKVLWIIRGQTS